MIKNMKKILGTLLCVCFLFFPSTQSISAKETAVTTIYAKDSEGKTIGSLSGDITQETTLLMESDPSKLGYGEIAKTYLNENPVKVLTYGINIEQGSYQGPLTLTFYLGEQYETMSAQIVFLKDNAKDALAEYEQETVTVKDGMAAIKLNYATFDTRSPFVIGLYPSSTKQPSTPIFQQRSLIDQSVKEVGISGSFSKDASFIVKPLEEASKTYQSLRAPIENATILKGYDMSLKQGSYQGTMKVSISLEEAANKEITIYQLLKNDKIATYTLTTSKDGNADFETSELSAFLITEKKEQKQNTNLYYIAIGVGTLLVVISLASMWKEKKKK